MACTYRFKDASGKEVVITGQAAMKAYLVEVLMPERDGVAAEEAEGRDAFTVARVENDELAKLTFRRGETIKVAGSYPMQTGHIKGISLSKRQFNIGGAWLDFGYAYKSDYDEFAAPRREMDELIAKAKKLIEDGRGFSRNDDYPMRKAREHAKRYALDEYNAELDALEAEGAKVWDKHIVTLTANQSARDKANSERMQAERDAAAKAQDNSPVKMTMDEWKRISKDFKSFNGGDRTAMIGGRMRFVEIVKPAAPDQAPTEAPQSHVAAHDATMEAARAGTLTPEQFKASFESVVSGAEAIKAELSTKTKAELLKMGGPFVQMRYANDKKADVVDAVYREMIVRYTLGAGVSYSMGKNSYENAVKRLVDATDADRLAQYANDYKEAVAEAAGRAVAIAKAIDDPKTLDDFRNAIRARMLDGKTRAESFLDLTPEQRIRYDELEAESTREAREARKREAKTEVRAAGQATGGQIIATKHTRDGYDLYVVQLADRLSADDYKTVLASTKRMGGWYSSFRGNGAVPGFQFKTRESANAFLAYVGGDTEGAKQVAQERRDAFADDRSQSAVERLTEMADRLEDRADESLSRDRKANTARRASMAASAEASANADKAMARTMRNIANAIKDGKAKFLDKVRQKVQVEMLRSFVSDAKYKQLTARHLSYVDFERNRHEPATSETADYATFPKYTADRADLARMGRELELIDGAKKLGQQLLKVADDVTDEYLKFVKENLNKVSTFRAGGGGPAIFSSRDDAERAIARSGFRGKAIVYSAKRGQNMVVMGPSMAKENGLWTADTSKRITLTDEAGEEITAKIESLNRNRERVYLPHQFSTTRERRAKLKAMGIETAAEFRAALREFIALSEAPSRPSKVKELERSMVGHKNDGLDFFPTPAGIAQQMVEAADIKEGMRVLEPSAGMGHIAEQIRESGVDPDVVEFSSSRRELLEAKGFNVVANDFMEASGEYDRIIMNPPFSDRRDAQHVQHAYGLLKPGGRLVAIMGEGVFFGQDKKATEFREWLDSVGGTSEKLPDGSFLDPSLPVSTGANARMVVIEKADDAPAALRTNAETDESAVSRDAAESFVRQFVEKYPSAPEIILADSFYQLPDDVQRDAIAQGSGPFKAKGAIKNGKIYVLRRNHHSMADMEATVFHEVLGHAGIRKLLGPKFSQELNKLFIGLGGYSGLEKIMAARGMSAQFHGYMDGVRQAKERNPDLWTDALAATVMTEEVFAHIAEQKGGQALRDRFMALVGMVRDWLRNHGFAELASLGESDILFMLQRARSGMRESSGIVRNGVRIAGGEVLAENGQVISVEGDRDFDALKVLAGRLGLTVDDGPTVFSNSLPESQKSGDDARMDDANNVAGKQAPTPAGDVEGSAQWAYETYQSGVVPDGWYVHGRQGRKDLNAGGVLQLTQDWDVADQYSGQPGSSKWLIRPKSEANTLDLSGSQTADMDRVVDAALRDFDRNRLPWLDDLEAAIGREAEASDVEDAVRDNFAPDNIVDSAKAYDSQSMSEWLAETFDYPSFVETPDGAVVFSREGIDAVMVPNEPTPSDSPDGAPALLRTTSRLSRSEVVEQSRPRGEMAMAAVGNVISAFKEPSTKVFGTLHKTIATQLHKAWVSKDYAKVFKMADAYERDISRFSANPAAAAPNLLPSFDSISAAFGRLVRGNKNAKLMDGVAEAVFSGTLAGEDVTSGRVWSDAELRDQFSLNDKQIELYREARAAIDESLDAAASSLAWQTVKKYVPDFKDSVRAETGNAETIIDGAMRELEEELREVARYQVEAEKEGVVPEGTAAKTIRKAQDVAEARVAAEGVFERADALKSAGYAPLMRFGKYAVDVVETLEDGTQERLGFYKFETELEAKLAAKDLQKKHPQAEVSRSVMSEESWKLYRGVDPELVSLFADRIEGLEGLEVQNEVLQEWYRSAVNDRSAFKRMIQRKGVEGFERDLPRVLANFVTSNARVAARQFNMGDIAKEIADMQDRKVSGDVVDEAVQLKEYMENPTEPFQGLKGWMFAWFLGGSVASAALNMTQPLMMTLPYLSQFGAGKAASSLAGAAKEARSGNVSDPELKRALARAAKDGKVDPQQVHHLYHEGMSSFLSKLPMGAGARERAQGFMTLWGYMFGAVENFNRRITFIAAYRMAKNDPSLGNPYDFAIKAIDDTQGIYNKANRPNWARGTGPFGAMGVAAFTFKQYSIGYIELLVRMAKSGKNGRMGAAAMLGLLVLLSGMQGFPGADDMEDIIDTVAQHLGYTGNSRLALRSKLKEMFGEEVGNVVMNGALSMLPFDIGSRVGLGNLLPATAIFKPSEQNRESQIAELFGPPMAMANQAIDATVAIESGGGFAGVAAAFAPVAFRNAWKGYDMAESGVYRDTRGRKVTDVSLADAMFKATGFQPSSVSHEQKGARLLEMTGQRVRMVKASINGLKARAIVENDNDLRARAENMRLDWNRKNPDAVIMPDAPAVMRRVKEMNMERRARLMKSLPKEYRRVAEGEMN